MKNDNQLHIRLPTNILKDFEKLSKKLNITKSEYLLTLIVKELDKKKYLLF